MRNLLRNPLTWMVIAEFTVLAVLMLVVWNVVAGAATQHAAAVAVSASDAPPDASSSPTPDIAAATTDASPAPMPGLNLNAAFWRARLGQLNRDQVIVEQLEWRVVHSAMDTVQRYLQAGYDTKAIIREYPSLTAADIETARHHSAAG